MTHLQKAFMQCVLFFLALSAGIPAASAIADTVYSINNNGTISIIDTANDSVTTPITLPPGSKPTALCLNPVTPYAYTLNPGNNSLSIIDTTNLTVVNTIYDPRFTELSAIACNSTGTSVLIGNNDSGGLSSSLLSLDTTSNTLSDLSTTVGINPTSIVFNKTGSKAYILSQGVPSLSELDTSTKQITATMALTEAEAPYALAIHTLDKYLYVVNILGNSVSFIDPVAMLLLNTTLVGTYPNSVTVSSSTNKLYVTDFVDTVSLFDPDSPSTRTLFSGDASGALVERNDGQKVYLASMFDDIIRSYDTSDFAAIPRQIQLPAGSSSRGLATLLGIRHNLNLNISGTGIGTVEWPFAKEYTAAAPVTSSIGVPDGIGVTVHASADTCSTVAWTGCDNASGGGTQSAFCSVFPFAVDKSINAEFIRNPSYNVTTTVPGGNGAITCPAQVCEGGTATCSITTAPGYTLTSLTDNGVSIIGNVTGGIAFQIQNIVANHSVQAEFTINSFTVTPSTDGYGQIFPDTAQAVAYNNPITFSLTPNPGGYSLIAVNGCGGTLSPGRDSYTTAPITGDCTVSAAYTLGTFIVSSQAPNGGGSVFCAPTSVRLGESSTCTINPNAGYHLNTLNDTGSPATSSVIANSYTIANISTHHDVVALFAINTYSVILNSGPNGSISGPTIVNYGDTPTYSFTPSSGYHVSNVIVDGVSVGAVSSYTFPTGITGPVTISATFAINSYTVTPSAGANGTISPATGQPVNYGSTASFNLTPATGYHIASVGGTCGGTLSGTTYTTVPVTADCTVTAAFAIDTFAVTFNSGGNGTLTGTTSQTVNYGAAATDVTAVPATGYHFVNWTGTGGFVTSTTNPLIVTNVTAAQTITANFAIDTFTLTFGSNGNGTLTGTASQTVNYGASATDVTAVPATGYHIVNWTGTGGFVTSTANPLVVTNVTAAQAITANFAINSYTVTPSAGANGTISPATGQPVNHGSTASFTLTPATGYHIDTVSGTCGGGVIGTTYTTVPVTTDCTVTAAFAIDTFAVTFSSGGNGTLTGTASQTVNYGASATDVTAVPATGYHFVNWTGTGGFVTSTANPLTVTNVTAAQAITANFAIDTFTVTFNNSGNGALTGTANQTVNYGASATAVTAVPATGYHFVNWTGTGGFVTSTANPLAVANVTASQAITANFAINSYTVTPSAGANGTISPAVGQPVNHGSTASFTLIPATGYHVGPVDSIGDTCGGTVSGTTYTTAAVTANCTAKPTFVINSYTVTTSIGVNGSISPSVQTVSYGATTSFTLTASPSYSVVSVTGCNGTLDAPTGVYTTGVITGNCSVSATFMINTYVVTSIVPGGNGTVTCTSPISSGSSSTCAITPATGYQLATLIDNSSDVFTPANTSSYTASNITTNHSIQASFSIKQFTVTPSAGANGTISPATGQPVNYGSTASFNLTPATGYHIASVGGTCGGTLSSTTYTTGPVTNDCTVTAAFAIDTFAVTFNSGGNGTLTGTTSQTVNYGAAATDVTAVPATGYHFVNWTGTGGFVTSTTNPLTVTNVTAAQTITANFAIDTFTLTFGSNGNGTLTGTANQTVNYGASATEVTAVPATGYHFVNWTGTGGFVSSTANPLAITNVTAAQAITANFAINSYTVTPSSGANGTITPASAQPVNHGSTASFTLTPATGYHIDTAGGTCGGTLSGSTYTTGPVTTDCTVTAAFAIDTFAVTFGSGGSGTLTGTTSQTVNYGASATDVTAVPATGYHFVNWTGTGGFVTSTANPLAVTNVTAAQAITANFAIDTFAITFGSSGNGTLTGTASQTVNYGASATDVTAVPATGYHFVNWTGTGGFVTSTANPLAVANVTAAQAITANFAINSYTVSPSAGANGTISPAVGQPVNHGSTVSFTLTPATGYHIDTVSGTCGGTLSGTTYTTAPVNADCTVIASFAINQYQATPTAGIGGSISPAIVQSITHGGSTSFTISPDTANGYNIVSVTGCDGTLSGNTFTTGAITANCTVSATFELNRYSVTTSIPGGNGSISCSPTTADFGASVSCTVTAAAGYQLATLADNGLDVLAPAGMTSYTISNINANHALAATFSLKSYAVTVGLSANGRATPSTVQTVTHGNSASFTLTPDTGYHIVSPVGGTCGGTLTGTTYTTSPIMTNCTVVIDYARNQYTVTATAGNDGSITPGTISTPYGSSVQFSVIPASGYSIGSVNGCNGSLSGTAFSTGIINGDCSISATFIKIPVVTPTTSGGNGTVTCSPPAFSGDNSTCHITPNIGYHLSSLTDNGTNVLASVINKNTYTLSNVTAPHTLSASFAPYSLADALRALRIAVGIAPPTSDEYLWVDVAPLDASKPKGNGIIDIMDALVLLKHSINTYTEW